jgi:hypothetical protein
MADDARPAIGYSPKSGDVRVSLLDGPLRGVTVGVPSPLPDLIVINGDRHGNHTIWITHTYRRTEMGYSHVQTNVDIIRTHC